MRPGLFLFWSLIIALLFNATALLFCVWTCIRSLRIDRKFYRMVGQTQAMLAVWSETWPEEQKQKLLLIFKQGDNR